jgi:mono/diheme cytochrome c family protein
LLLGSRHVIAIATVLVTVSAAGLYALLDRSTDRSRADPADPERVASGKKLYDVHCAACHGQNLEGQPNWQGRLATGFLPAPPHDESGHTWHHPDQVLFRITKLGGAAEAPAGFKSNMPGFGGTLTDEQIWAILAYIKSRWPQHIQSRQAEIDRRNRGR